METGSQPPEPGAMAQHHAQNRAQSRASTASLHSVATQPNHDQNFASNQVSHHVQHPHPHPHPNPNSHPHHSLPHHPHPPSGSFHGQWAANEQTPTHNNGMTKDMPATVAQPHMPAGEMMLRPASQMQPNQSFSMDSSMHSTVANGMQSFTQHPGVHQQLPADSSFGPGVSFNNTDSQMVDSGDQGESFASVPPAGKPATTRTSANNELEMRQLFQQNKHRSLEEVAAGLHGNERGPTSERTRQIFAMLWIDNVCSKGKGSVPRGRVYANYVSRCATERITVLNPASFGKLVRVLFPGLKTRRLGVRGESKYHYVNFSLAEDQPEVREPPIQPAIPYPGSSHFAPNASATNSQPNGVDAGRPSPTSASVQHQAKAREWAQSASVRVSGRTHSLYNLPDVSNLDQLELATQKTTIHLSFEPDHEGPLQQSEPLKLPPIEPFLPLGTDSDAAKSLTAVYLSHCTSLIECIRYCKEKTFFHLYTSFQGTLTMPVQKLFGNPSIALWIEECDFILYQRMMRIVSSLTLQVVPKQVLDTLRNISEKLVPHIRESFQGQPKHVVQAKEAPATIFAGLIDRSLRVNLTAHAAANMLANPANRDQMYSDWITMVRIRKVAESIPTRGMDDVVKLLLDEIRGLLQPVNIAWESECLTLYGDVVLRDGRNGNEGASGEMDGQSHLDRWVSFLRSLPARFPYASAGDIVWCVQRIGNDVMRDLTLCQGKSFGSWWVTKCWIDEMISFLPELGGFLNSTSSVQSAARENKGSLAEKEATQPSRQGSQLSSSSDLNGGSSRVAQPDRAPFPSHLDPNQQESQHDDSGIGIRTPEEDFPMDEKFDFPQDRDEELPLGL